MPETNPFFTLCIPVYNSGSICHEAIQSALAQNFADYEIVIVDDNSSDNSWQVLSEYGKQAKIRLYRNEQNLGMTGNWNRCLELAKGNFIGFVHHDDAISPHFLSDAHEIITKNPSVGIMAFLNQNNQKRPLMGKIDHKNYFRATFSMIHVPPPSETIFINEGLRYDSQMVYCPEIDLYLQLSKLGYAAYHSDQVNVTRNPTKWTGSVTAKTHYAFDRFQDNLYIIKKWRNDNWLNKNDATNTLQTVSKELLKRFVRGKILGAKQANGLFENYRHYLIENRYFGLTHWDKTKLFASVFPAVFFKIITSITFLMVSAFKRLIRK